MKVHQNRMNKKYKENRIFKINLKEDHHCFKNKFKINNIIRMKT